VERNARSENPVHSVREGKTIVIVGRKSACSEKGWIRKGRKGGKQREKNSTRGGEKRSERIAKPQREIFGENSKKNLALRLAGILIAWYEGRRNEGKKKLCKKKKGGNGKRMHFILQEEIPVEVTYSDLQERERKTCKG